jgi:hypothetical protein
MQLGPEIKSISNTAQFLYSVLSTLEEFLSPEGSKMVNSYAYIL